MNYKKGDEIFFYIDDIRWCKLNFLTEHVGIIDNVNWEYGDNSIRILVEIDTVRIGWEGNNGNRYVDISEHEIIGLVSDVLETPPEFVVVKLRRELMNIDEDDQ